MKLGIKGARKKLASCLDEVEFYRRQFEQIEERMVEMLEKLRYAELIMSIPGVGPVVAARVLGEAGDLRRFKNWKQLRKLTGFNLVEQSSGQKKSQSVISKRGRPALRHILYLAALAAVGKNKEFKGLYQALTTRPRNALKGKQALVAVATNVLGIMFALVKSDQTLCG